MKRGRMAGAALGAALLVGTLATIVLGQAEETPQVLQPQPIETPLSVSEGGILFVPAPEEPPPAISGERAVELAREEMPGAKRAASIQASYGLFTKVLPERVLYDKVPAWIVTMKGMCVPAFGPAVVDVDGETRLAEPPRCIGNEWNVVVDANTGEILLDFSYQ